MFWFENTWSQVCRRSAPSPLLPLVLFPSYYLNGFNPNTILEIVFGAWEGSAHKLKPEHDPQWHLEKGQLGSRFILSSVEVWFLFLLSALGAAEVVSSCLAEVRDGSREI